MTADQFARYGRALSRAVDESARPGALDVVTPRKIKYLVPGGAYLLLHRGAQVRLVWDPRAGIYSTVSYGARALFDFEAVTGCPVSEEFGLEIVLFDPEGSSPDPDDPTPSP